MKTKRLTKADKFILLHTGPGYNFYRCPQHGVFAQHRTLAQQGNCWSTCTCPIETIADPVAYAEAK